MKTAERVGDRTRHAKHFDSDMPGQFVAEVTTGPQHFVHKDTSEWTDIDLLLEDDGSGGFITVADDVDWSVQGGWVRVGRRGRDSFNLRPDALYLVDTATNSISKVADASYAGGVVRDGLTVTLAALYPGMDLEVRFSDDRLTKNWVIASALTLPDPVALGMDPATTVLAISWDLQTSLPIKDEGGVEIVDGWTSSETLMVEGSDSQPLLYWHKPEGYDSGLVQIPMAYGKFRQGGTRIDLAETVAYLDITDLALTYPVYLDPSTTIEETADSDDGFIKSDWTVYSVTDLNSVAHITGGAGYQYRAFFRYDLSSLAGYTCDSAKMWSAIRESTSIQSQPNQKIYVERVADWSPLSGSDYDMTVISILLGPLDGDQVPEAPGGPPYWIEYEWVFDAANTEAAFGGVIGLRWRGTYSGSDATAAFKISAYERDPEGEAPYLSIVYSDSAVPGTYFDFEAGEVTVISGTP